jgi:hypothetical protein
LPEPWDGDPPGSEARIEANVVGLWPSIAADAANRATPLAALAQRWHRAIYRGVRLPIRYYAGEFRDSDPRFPELYGYEVRVGGRLGAPSADVPGEVQRFEERVQDVCRRLDGAIPAGRIPRDEDELRAVIALTANAHGEWVRIHPFANGNGRTARVWANWLAVRYALPPFVRVKPRPDGATYGVAAAASMGGDHSLTAAVFRALLNEHLGARQPADG